MKQRILSSFILILLIASVIPVMAQEAPGATWSESPLVFDSPLPFDSPLLPTVESTAQPTAEQGYNPRIHLFTDGVSVQPRYPLTSTLAAASVPVVPKAAQLSSVQSVQPQAVTAEEPFDPRTENAKAFHVNSANMVDGVELHYDARPWTTYQIVQARLVDEASAAGNVTAKFVVVDCNGVPVSENVYLAWPYPQLDGGKALPGNQNNEHMIYSTYQPPNIGPLAMYVGDSKGNIISDVIGGLGLPFNRHVSYYVAFKKRCGVQVVTPVPSPAPTSTPIYVAPTQTPVPTVTPQPIITVVPPTATPSPVISGDLAETNSLLRQILAVMSAMAKHFGVPGYATP